MLPFAAIIAVLQVLPDHVHDSSTGLEWMVVMSLLLPALLIFILVYWGSKRTV